MNIHDVAGREVADLLEMGQQLVNQASRSGSDLVPEAVTRASSWIARTGQLLQRLYPGDSHHRQMFDRAIQEHDFTTAHSNYYTHFSQVVGILESVTYELENGLIVDFRRLLQAGIFADFLEMAEYLLSEEYKDAAAVLISGVMEDALRQLADANNIATKRRDGKSLTIDPLNVELAKAGIYDRLIQKQITSWADLRNNAAHGNYDEYDSKQVKMMLLFVEKFLSDYLR